MMHFAQKSISDIEPPHNAEVPMVCTIIVLYTYMYGFNIMQGAEFPFHMVILQILAAALHEKVNQKSKVDKDVIYMRQQ